MKKILITTKRLQIRPLEKKDFKVWQRAYSNSEIKQNQWDLSVKSKKELSLDHYNKVLIAQKNNRDQDKFYDLAVFSKMNGELIGFVSLMDLSRSAFQNAYLGYRIFSPYWKQGYGKEMVKAVIELAFNDLKLHRVEAGIDPNNRRSIFLARSVGMRKEGLKKRALYLGNKWQDIVMYSITCEDLKIKFKGELKTLGSRLR